MTRADLLNLSIHEIRSILKAFLPPDVQVHIFGSRSCGDNRWTAYPPTPP